MDINNKQPLIIISLPDTMRGELIYAPSQILLEWVNLIHTYTLTQLPAHFRIPLGKTAAKRMWSVLISIWHRLLCLKILVIFLSPHREIRGQ